MYVHALHTVHALPELRVAAGRLRDGVSVLMDIALFWIKRLARQKPSDALFQNLRWALACLLLLRHRSPARESTEL